MNILTRLASATIFALAATMGPAVAQVNLTIGHPLTPGTHYDEFAQRFKTLIEERSNGEITATVFGQSQLGGEVRMLQSARAGAMSIVVTSSAAVENTVPEFSMLATPYLFKDLDEANAILQGEFGDHMLSYLDDRGYVGLGFISAIERNVFTSNRAIRTLTDFQNLKLRVIQGPAFVDTYQALGAQATPMAYSELYVALQNNVVDGAEGSPDTMISDRFVEVSRYYNLTRTQYMPALAIMSEVQFNRLSAEHQQLVMEVATEARAHAVQVYVDTYATSIEAIQEAGLEVVETDTASLIEATRDVAAQLIAASPDGEANAARIEAVRAAE